MFYLARTVNGKATEYTEESDLSQCSILMFKSRADAEKKAKGLEMCKLTLSPVWSVVEVGSNLSYRGDTHPMFLSQ
jgi:hypothetical protein